MILFFLAFMAITSFGLMNIIVGIVVENTLQAADAQRRLEQQQQMLRVRAQLEALKSLFEQADNDGSGLLDVDEFIEIVQNPNVQARESRLRLQQQRWCASQPSPQHSQPRRSDPAPPLGRHPGGAARARRLGLHFLRCPKVHCADLPPETFACGTEVSQRFCSIPPHTTRACLGTPSFTHMLTLGSLRPFVGAASFRPHGWVAPHCPAYAS